MIDFNIYSKIFGDIAVPELIMSLLLSVVIFSIFKVVAIILSKKAQPILKKLLLIRDQKFEDAIVATIAKPVNLFVTVTGIVAAVMIIPFGTETSVAVDAFVVKAYRLVIVAILGMLAVGFVDNLQHCTRIFEENENKTLLQFFIKVAKVIVIFIVVATLLKEIGFDVTGLMTSLGLGGVILALAAQDTASNLFAGVVILFDKPFAVGDWISVAGMEGVVEEMSFRSCRIRTFDNALISVPNSKLGSDSVTNWTKMNVRKTRITIGLVYGTKKEALQKICDDIKANLLKYDSVKDDNIMVWFDNFNASSLDIVVQYHTYLTGGADYFALKEEIQYMIMDVVESNGSDFAFNTQTIIVENQ